MGRVETVSERHWLKYHISKQFEKENTVEKRTFQIIGKHYIAFRKQGTVITAK